MKYLNSLKCRFCFDLVWLPNRDRYEIPLTLTSALKTNFTSLTTHHSDKITVSVFPSAMVFVSSRGSLGSATVERRLSGRGWRDRTGSAGLELGHPIFYNLVFVCADFKTGLVSTALLPIFPREWPANSPAGILSWYVVLLRPDSSCVFKMTP